MTRITLVITLLLFTHLLYAQTFNKRYGVNSDLGYAINCRGATVMDSSIFFLIGEVTDIEIRPALYRTDLMGNLNHIKEYYDDEGNYSLSWADYIQKTNDGNLIFCIPHLLNSVGDFSLGNLYKVNSNGDILWEKFYGDSIHDHFFQQVKSTSDGGFIAIGNAELTEFQPKFYVVKTDSLGNEEWHTYLGYGTKYRQSAWINELPDGSGYVVSGFEDDTSYDPVGLVFVIDTLGNVLDWEKYSDWGPYDDQGASAILPCSEGGYVFSTQYNVEQIGMWDFEEIPQIVRIDENLDTMWTCNLIEEPNIGGASSQVIVENSDGSFVATGTIGSSTSDGVKSEGHISKVSPNGQLIWHRRYHYAPYGDNLLFDIDKMPNGGYLCTGWMNGMPAFGDSIPDQDAWLIAVDSMGCLVPGCDTLTDATTELIPIQFSIYLTQQANS